MTIHQPSAPARRLLALSLALAGAAVGNAQLTDPIPGSIPAGLSVEIIDVAAAPVLNTSTNWPASKARINAIDHANDGRDRLFVNDLYGPLYLLRGGRLTTYADLRTAFPRFSSSSGLAGGFVAFAFDPEFAANGRFYTVHTERTSGSPTPDLVAPDRSIVHSHSVLTEWTATDPAADVFAGTRREVLRIEQTGNKHQMGQIAFNPHAEPGDADYGLLYVPQGESDAAAIGKTVNLQRLDSVFGTLLRIDPRGTNGVNGRYGIPASNPFVGTAGARGEIYAYGFRNPHRIAWDPAGPGRLLLSDIGEDHAEEINLIEPGRNYGWPVREGTFEIRDVTRRNLIYPLPANDAELGFTYPVAQYDHNQPGVPVPSNWGIAGAFVYRGTAIPHLAGQVIFGDINHGRLFHVAAEALVQGQQAPISELTLTRGGTTTDLATLANGASSDRRTDLRLGQGPDGEIYVLTKRDGMIRRLTVPGAVTLSAESASFTTEGGSGSLGITIAPATAAWAARETASWLTLTGDVSGVGAGTVTYQVAPNPSNSPRVTELAVGDRVLRIEQAGAPPEPGRLVNLSARAHVGVGENALIAGFVAQGAAPLRVLVRAVGPGLAAHNVQGRLADPTLGLARLDAGLPQPLAVNYDWMGNELVTESARLGAFPLMAGSLDAALLVNVANGRTTARVFGVADTTGIALAEVYDAGATGAAERLVNLSARARVGSGEQVLIGGFVVRGAPTRLLLRAAGPSLVNHGITTPLATPVLRLFGSGSSVTPIATNQGWSTATNAIELAQVATAVGAFDFAAGSADSAVLTTLQPGVYTVVVSGANGAEGVALVEIYLAD